MKLEERNKWLRILFLVFLASGIVLRGQTSSLNTGTPTGIGSFHDGFMFDIEAVNDLVVDSFDVENWFFSYPENVEIWTTIDGGSSLGREQDPGAWELLTNPSIAIPPLPSGGSAPGGWFPLPASIGAFIKAGTQRGFYIATTSPGAFIALGAIAANTVKAGNNDMILRSGYRVTDFSRSLPDMPSLQVHYLPKSPNPIDIRTHEIVSPSNDALSCDQGAADTMVGVEFLNLGTQPILSGSCVPVSLTVDGNHISNEFVLLGATVAPGESFRYTFLASVDLSLVGDHVIDVTHSFPGDADNSDDTSTITFVSGGELRVVDFPFFEDFEERNVINSLTTPRGWSHQFGDPLNPWSEWQFSSERGFAPTTRPDADHTTGISGAGTFAHTNDDGNFGDVGLRSPCFDLTNVSVPKMSFWLYSDTTASAFNELHVDVVNMTTGQTTLDIVPMYGNLGPQWLRQEIDLSAFSGEVVRVIFRATTNYPPLNVPTTNLHEFAIDDFALFDFTPSLGQPEQPGFASFLIGNPLNASFETVESGANGPFFSTIKANELMRMRFSGEPNQAVLLIGGALNPRAATFPVIGSLDLGGTVDPISGIPSGLVVLGDGDLSFGANPFFNTGFSGEGEFGVVIPNLPPGPFLNMQCAIRTSGANGSYIALSNAIALTLD